MFFNGERVLRRLSLGSELPQRAATLIAALFFFLLTGCTQDRVRSRLAERETSQASELKGLKASLRDDAQTRLTWEKAVERLERDNAALQRSRKSLADAKNARAEVWKSLIPRVSLFFGLSSFLGEIADSALSDVNGQVRANFNIPSPFNLYGQFYAAELGSISADWSHEVDRRRARRELYVAFGRALDLEFQKQQLEQDQKALSRVSLESLPASLESLESRRENFRRNEIQSRLSLNRLLGTPGANWHPVGKLPNISYADQLEELKFGENIGQLGLKLEAANIEGAHLAVSRIKLQRWPVLNFGLAGPAIFSSNSNAPDFELENFIFFSGVTDSYDLTDPLDIERIQNAETRLEATLAQMRVELETEIVQFEQARGDYRGILTAKMRTQRQIEFLESSSVTNATQLLENFDEIARLRENLRRLEARQMRLDLEYWIWDESAW